MPLRKLIICGVLGAAVTGCYAGELDAALDRVYFCEADTDCALGSSCVDSICEYPLEELDPTLQIVSPSALEAYAMGESGAIPIVLAGDRIALTAEASDERNAGYVEVLVDGAIVETVTAGSLTDGIAIDSVAMPPDPGLHHITLVARRVDGELFESPQSVTSTGFWVDDGNEHVGILSPAPGAKIPLGESANLKVEVASLNFTLVNPGFVSAEEVEEPGLGYVNLYLDAPVPACLPGCNFEHQSGIIPAGLSRVNRIVAEQGVLLPEGIGTVQIQIVAQTLAHAPYQREADVGAFVFHSVPVQSTVGVQP